MTSPWLNEELSLCYKALASQDVVADWEKIYLGFDLGTTNMVLVALNEEGKPVSVVMESSNSSVKDGVVVDYMASIRGMEKCIERLTKITGDISSYVVGGAAAYPPGVHPKSAKVCSNVIEALGYDCLALYEEPQAAAEALHIEDGVIVDIGGGTTGISIMREGKVLHSYDEPTGGTHMTLVLSGALGLSFDDAEMEKRKNKSHYVHLLEPVIEKMGSIVAKELKRYPETHKLPVVMVGGGADLPGAEKIMSHIIGREVFMAPHSLCVTPLGIARSLWRSHHDR